MTGFFRRADALVCDGVPLAAIAAAARHAALRLQRRHRRALSRHRRPRSPAIRTRSTTRSRPIRRWRSSRLLRGLGSHADANSGGEIDVALRAGFLPSADRVHRRRQDGRRARSRHRSRRAQHQRRVGGEIERIDALSRERGRPRPGSRSASIPTSTPDASAHLHRAEDQQVRHPDRRRRRRCSPQMRAAAASRSSACTPTSDRRSPTSSRCARARGAGRSRPRARRLDRTCASSTSISAAVSASPTTARRCRRGGLRARRCPPSCASRARIVLEPGRLIVGPAGVLLTRVVDVKAARRRVFVDGRRHDRADPADDVQRLPPHRAGRARAAAPRSPISSAPCARAATRSAGTARFRREVGDLFAVLDAGAYGSVMASNYNRRRCRRK